MGKNMKALLILSFLILASFSFAHEEAEEMHEEESVPGIVSMLESGFATLPLYSLLAILLLTGFSVHYKSVMGATAKKAVFIFIAAAVVAVTIFLASGTVYLNMISDSGGPVHWHADFEIYACGEKQTLPSAFEWCRVTQNSLFCGLTNKVGTEVFHHHDDYRIHVEGVVVNLSSVSMGKFFSVTGGKFTETEIGIPQKDGPMKVWKNGDMCPDGRAGSVNFYVNGVRNEEYGKYVLKPFGTVPPGDFVEIKFE